jgi:deoxyribodipyrimidine photo-lyase
VNVPKEFIFEPWTMPEGLQQQIGVIIGDTYPEPVVDHLATARHAREVMWALRREPETRAEARRVFDKHGSRNPAREGGRPSKSKTKSSELKKEEPKPTPQLSLGLE